MRTLFLSSGKAEIDRRRNLAREVLALVRDLGLIPSYWLTGPLCREMERWYTSRRFYDMHKEFVKNVSPMLNFSPDEIDAAAFFNHFHQRVNHVEEVWHEQFKLEFPD